MRHGLLSGCVLSSLVVACSGAPPSSSALSASQDDSQGDASTTIPAVTAPNSLDDVLQSLVQANGAGAVGATLHQFVAGAISDPTVQAALDSQIDARIAGTSTGPFPVLPFSLLVAAPSLVDEFAPAGAAPPAAPPTAFNLAPPAAGTTCQPSVPSLTPISASLPGLSRGGVADPTADPCTLSHLEDFVTALNGLAMQDGTTVIDGANTYTDVGDVITDLLATHTVTVEANRYYADFLGLYYNGQSVAAPVWIDTGIALPTGGTLVVPAPHAGYSMHFTGPQINGTIEFYMGVTAGTAFRPYNSVPRAPWQGGRAQYTYNSGTDNATIVKIFTTASDLRHKWMGEAVAQSLPLLGYGTLGVCMDSAAVIESNTEGKDTLFPLAHPVPTTQSDYIDAILASLPSDFAGFTDASAIPRIGTSVPMSGSDLQNLFPLVASELTSLGLTLP